jgi:hypothetical protein
MKLYPKAATLEDVDVMFDYGFGFYMDIQNHQETQKQLNRIKKQHYLEIFINISFKILSRTLIFRNKEVEPKDSINLEIMHHCMILEIIFSKDIHNR